jgi:hypothetical protein
VGSEIGKWDAALGFHTLVSSFHFLISNFHFLTSSFCFCQALDFRVKGFRLGSCLREAS